MSLDNHKLSEPQFSHLSNGANSTFTRARCYIKLYSCKKYHILNFSFKRLNSDHSISVIIQLSLLSLRNGEVPRYPGIRAGSILHSVLATAEALMLRDCVPPEILRSPALLGMRLEQV